MQVKISSEDAGSIALTPVVVQEMPVRDLVELMLGLTGKDAQRIAELLKRGTFVSGASRFRWAGIEMDVSELLTAFPNSDPSRPFVTARCVKAVLRGGPSRIEIARETMTKKRLLKSDCFWDVLIDAAASPKYIDYSYKEKADLYRAPLQIQSAKRIKDAASLLAYSVLAAQVQALVLDAVDFYLPRE